MKRVDASSLDRGTDKIYFRVEKKIPFAERYQQWVVDLASSYSEEYVETLRAIEKLIGSRFNLNWEFDECTGHAEVKYGSDWRLVGWKSVRDVIKEIEEMFDLSCGMRVYYKCGNVVKTRTSRILKYPDPSYSGYGIESVFWDALKNELRYLHKLERERQGKEMDVGDCAELYVDALNSALHYLIWQIVECYEHDLSEESFIEWIRDNEDDFEIYEKE